MIIIATPTPKILNTPSVLSQADVADLILFVVTEFGAEITGEISSNWDTVNNVLEATIDSGSFRGENAVDIEMSIAMNSSGDILSLYVQAMLIPGQIQITANIVPADINSTRKQIVKKAYYASDALEKVPSATTNNDIALITLGALGYTQITGISSNWDAENSTATIVFDNAMLDSSTITDAQIIISIDSNGDIDSYSASMLINNTQENLNQEDLDDVQVFVLKVGNYSMADLYNIEQAANHTSLLTNNISFDLYEDGNNTNQNFVINQGELQINEIYSFDSIKITNTENYSQSINISDAIDVLRHIVDLEVITEGSYAYHAADVNNDGNINISDAIDILRHIVDLEAIDTFDLIDSDGNRVTQLNANASGEPPIWAIVANGDVDMSGSFADDYVVSSELV